MYEAAGIEVFVKRDDLIHPVISGNKWRKLQLNLEKCKVEHYEGILTFGGAYSNHISALARAGKEFNLKTIGIIRGDELNNDSNSTLQQATRDGMELVFVSREEYSWRYEKDYINQLRSRFGNYLVVEEGGANFYGIMGCVSIVKEISEQFDFIMLPVGTGTTATGILLGTSDAKIIGVPVFKNGNFIREDIKSHLNIAGLSDEMVEEKSNQLLLETKHHFGGYGKFTNELIDFMNAYYEVTKLPLDQVYTGKMMFTLHEMIKNGRINAGSKILVIHTGGLQGIKPIQDRLNYSD